MTMDQPQTDPREYRRFPLASDSASLDVLLISDPSTEKASAACDIHVGQFQDPLEWQGLAHFCEHMLFIGTEKYPQENAYDSFLGQQGGSSNAYTDLEHTCYYFDVSAAQLEGALDRMAQCFIAPLFTASALEREIQAVDSEHAKNTQQDVWRLDQLSKIQIVEDDKHPYGRFGSGNLKTLPIQQTDGSSLRDALINFFELNYRAHLGLYKLVVLGKESLDELQAMVARCFGPLTEKKYAQNDAATPDLLKTLHQPLPSQLKLPKQVHAVAVAQTHAVELQFPMREIQSLWKSKPTRYLSHLLGHEGEGSLLSLLKERHWAHELYADDGSKSGHSFCIFTVRIELTQAGLDALSQVISIVFAYVDLLQKTGPQEWVFTELQTVGEMQFRFLSKRQPMDTTSTIVPYMHQYPAEQILSGPYRFWDWRPDLVQECLDFLRPSNVLILVSSPNFAGSTSGVERHYETQYEVVPISEADLTRYQSVKADEFPELTLPLPNDLIATNFDLLRSPGSQDNDADFPKNEPVCLIDTNISRLWYKPDNVFGMPKVNILLEIETPVATGSPVATERAKLWCEYLREELAEFSYLASMAGLHYDVSNAATGLEVQVSGYNHKAHVLLGKIVDSMANLSDKMEAALFDRLVDKMEKQYQAWLVGQPYQHAVYGGDLCLDHRKFSVFDKMEALKEITLSDLKAFSDQLCRRCHLEALIHGNVSTDEARAVMTLVSDKLAPLPLFTRVENRVVQLEAGKKYLYRFSGLSPADNNSVLELLFSMGPMDYEENAALALLGHLMREPAFNQLRTEAQLGYIVHTSIKTLGANVKGFLILIMSDSYTPVVLQDKVVEFLSWFRQYLVNLSSEDFQANVDAVVTSLTQSDKNLGEESSRYWQVISNKTYQFHRLEEIARNVESSTNKARVLRFFDKYFASSSPDFKSLSIQVVSPAHAEEMKKLEENLAAVAAIDDPMEFRRTMPLYPLPKKQSVKAKS